MESTETAATSTSTGTTKGFGGFDALCDVCARPVSDDDFFQTELTAQGATCPTMMTFHLACYEAASTLWVPEGADSTCRVDPLFPETGQWTPQPAPVDTVDR